MFGRFRKPKASANPRGVNPGGEVSRCYFDINDVQMYFDYSGLLDEIDRHTSLEEVIQLYDRRHATDFYNHIGDDAIALYRYLVGDLPEWTEGAVEVRSWWEACMVERSVPRVYLERNGRFMKLFLDDSSGDPKADVRGYDSRHRTDFAKHIKAGDVRVVSKWEVGDAIAFPVETWDDVLAYADRRR